MRDFLAELAARRRFGMKPGLDAIRSVCTCLDDPQRKFRAIHVAGTNGKGAVCAILDSTLRAAGLRIGRYTSPHLVMLNERFFLDGAPISDEILEKHAETVENALCNWGLSPKNGGLSPNITFFEALTAVGFLAFAEAKPAFAILECGLGGRLDATNVCLPAICAITRIGLDHCDWLGGTVEAIAMEKAGIIKPGVPVVLGKNSPTVRDVVSARAAEVDAPFVYAPDVADESEIPDGFSLAGAFNRENAVTALAVLKTLGRGPTTIPHEAVSRGFASVIWPGRFQRVRNFIIDGAHNPPAAEALSATLAETSTRKKSLSLIAGFCGDKDAGRVLALLAPFVRRALAVRVDNPRSLSAEATAEAMRLAGMDSTPCGSLAEAIAAVGDAPTLICGSLFLAGGALVALGAYPWPHPRRDPSEVLHPGQGRSHGPQDQCSSSLRSSSSSVAASSQSAV